MIGMYNNVILERHYKKGSRKGRFKISEKNKEFWKSWDNAVSIPEKQLNPNTREHYHRNSLVEKMDVSDTRDYKMKVFNCDRKTKKMYEAYYKTHSYT